MSVGVLYTSLDNERQAQMADDVGGHHVEDEECVMHALRAVHATWADFADLDSAHSLSMTCAQEVNVHGEVCEEDLQGECHSRLAISTLVDDQGEVVDLEYHTEISDRAKLARDKHSSLGK